MLNYLLLSTIIFLSYIIKSVSGFGSSLFSIPFLTHLYPIELIIPTLTSYDFTANFLLVIRERKNILYKKIFTLFIGFIPGTLLGIFLLNNLSTDNLKKVIGFFVIIFSFRIILSEKINFKKISNLLSSQKSGIIFGIFSGFLGAIMAIDGPPIIIYLTESIRKKDKLRATLFFTFLLFSFIRLFTFIITGVFTKNTFIFLIQALPFVVLGSITGVKLSKYISEKHFKKIIALLIMITGLFLFF